MRVPSPWVSEWGTRTRSNGSWGDVARGGCDSSTSTALRAEYEYKYGRDPRSRYQKGAEHRQTIAHGVRRGMGFKNGKEPRERRQTGIG